ncbi:type II toxin-antitoxin system PemK/MazF family toxin [Geobacillus sp. C56-T2]|uniref:type II toxin-antitoxin system PemK/MazF family toxin n=1 Tax=unclassified Geobacillus TaxID=2642459 RepID=UPI0011A8B925|nr:type II toxin-antitoxin system PemK/MazF family toxin [Geobacillus sp. C56-T2]NNV06897.1 type II toxin-antitoxin system PemK/MazF family toxin [Geobacillus sp. MMMUD3]TWG31832.1 mRNA-degrading endonuclease toxin of MazEF toxin-antitoxin module [Geobacillus sp. C56-T2]
MFKKLHENKDLVGAMNKQLMELQKIIENMDEKRGKIFIEWLGTQNKYLVWEETFDPSYLRAYKRSEIVLAHFGFNVGAEFGGMHYAVVIRDSSKNNPVVNVVPLSSLDENETEQDVHKDSVFLGTIEGLNEKRAVAIPNQMRPISKIRIFKPKKAKDDVFKLTSEQMDLIDEKIRRMYTKLKKDPGNYS